MKRPIFARGFTIEEKQAIDKALRGKSAFSMRRAQILRLSSQQKKIPWEIADYLGCAVQTVRNVIRAFNSKGIDCLQPVAMGPKNPKRTLDACKREQLQEIAHHSPRKFGKPRSEWTLELLAEVSYEQGLTEEQVSHETIRQAINALGASWQRAKHWISSPDEQYAIKKNSGTG
jgi:transposase